MFRVYASLLAFYEWLNSFLDHSDIQENAYHDLQSHCPSLQVIGQYPKAILLFVCAIFHDAFEGTPGFDQPFLFPFVLEVIYSVAFCSLD